MKAAHYVRNFPLLLKIWAEGIRAKTKGQDLIEYALMAAAVAVGCAALLPNLAANLNRIFTAVASALTVAATSGS